MFSKGIMYIDKTLFLICKWFLMDWRIAKEGSVFTKGSKSEPRNYRPVSLTSVVGKMFLRAAILEYVNEIKHITPYQHGFI